MVGWRGFSWAFSIHFCLAWKLQIIKYELNKELIMEEKTVLEKIAYLESVNDQLMAELTSVDQLMRRVGFENGLQTVKNTAQGLFDGDYIEEQE